MTIRKVCWRQYWHAPKDLYVKVESAHFIRAQVQNEFRSLKDETQYFIRGCDEC